MESLLESSSSSGAVNYRQTEPPPESSLVLRMSTNSEGNRERVWHLPVSNRADTLESDSILKTGF